MTMNVFYARDCHKPMYYSRSICPHAVLHKPSLQPKCRICTIFLHTWQQYAAIHLSIVTRLSRLEIGASQLDLTVNHKLPVELLFIKVLLYFLQYMRIWSRSLSVSISRTKGVWEVVDILHRRYSKLSIGAY